MVTEQGVATVPVSPREFSKTSRDKRKLFNIKKKKTDTIE